MEFLLLAGLLLNGASTTHGSPKSAWSFSEKGYGIYSPQLSPDNQQLVHANHVPDGHEAEMLSDEALQESFKRMNSEPRFGDPQVMLMQLGDGSMRRIDYGWSPVFSASQTRLAYTYQKEPITGKRVLAATPAGSEIRVCHFPANKLLLWRSRSLAI